MDEFEAVPERKPLIPGFCLWMAGLILFGFGGCAAGLGGLLYLGLDRLEKDLAGALRENPVIVEHLGEIVSCDYQVIDTVRQGKGHARLLRVTGRRGAGLVEATFERAPDGGRRLADGVLVLDDGTRHDLLPPKPPPPAQDLRSDR